MKKFGFDETQKDKRVDDTMNPGRLTGNWETDSSGCWWEYILDRAITREWIMRETSKEEKT